MVLRAQALTLCSLLVPRRSSLRARGHGSRCSSSRAIAASGGWILATPKEAGDDSVLVGGGEAGSAGGGAVQGRHGPRQPVLQPPGGPVRRALPPAVEGALMAARSPRNPHLPRLRRCVRARGAPHLRCIPWVNSPRIPSGCFPPRPRQQAATSGWSQVAQSRSGRLGAVSEAACAKCMQMLQVPIAEAAPVYAHAQPTGRRSSAYFLTSWGFCLRSGWPGV